jgi:hypothetical protein
MCYFLDKKHDFSKWPYLKLIWVMTRLGHDPKNKFGS